MRARVIPSLFVVLATSCGPQPEARNDPPADEDLALAPPATSAQPPQSALQRPGTLLRVIELPPPGPYQLVALGDGRLAASRSERTVLIEQDGSLARELPFGGLVAADRDGNLYVAGEFSESIQIGGVSYASAGGLDAFIVKLDPSWTVSWVRQVGSAAQERPRELATDGANVIVMGTGIGTLELDATGATRWTTGLAGTDFAVAADGSLLVAGGFLDELRIGTDAYFADQPSVFIAKLDERGRPVWSRAFSATSEVEVDRVSTDPRGNLALVGAFRGSLSLGGSLLEYDSADGEPYTTGFFAKYDGDGNHVCSRPSEIASPFELVADSKGNFALTGSISDDDRLLELRVLGPDGSELWRKSAPSEIELGTGYGFDIALEQRRLFWSVDAFSKAYGGSVLVPRIATYAL